MATTAQDLIEALSQYPKDAKLELGKFLALDSKSRKKLMQVRLDYPIAGVAHNPETNEVMLVVSAPGDAKHWLLEFGKVTEFKG